MFLMKNILTPSLLLRKLRFSDLEDYFKIVGDAETMAFIVDRPYNRTESDNEVQRLIDRYGKNNVYGIWVAERIDNGQFIGIGGLIQVGEKTADIGYRVQRKYWGLGYGLSIAKLLISKAKEEGLNLLVAEVEQENKASIHILEKLGFIQTDIITNELGNNICYYKMKLD
jgi:RimJ/RimL family protein N-acetyltransferase